MLKDYRIAGRTTSRDRAAELCSKRKRKGFIGAAALILRQPSLNGRILSRFGRIECGGLTGMSHFSRIETSSDPNWIRNLTICSPTELQVILRVNRASAESDILLHSIRPVRAHCVQPQIEVDVQPTLGLSSNIHARHRNAVYVGGD
jgi:hypothetical protein